jgi:hypothetical protein
MNSDQSIVHIERLDACIKPYIHLCETRVSLLEENINQHIQSFKEITENKVADQVLSITPYFNYLYLSAEYHLASALFYASPGLWALLIGIWGVLVFIYNAIKWIVDILHIRELLAIADILRIVWPAFRDKYDKILGKISEFSAQIGWGTDGLIHLIQASQSGMNIIRGLTGKSFEWLKIASAEKAIRSLKIVSALSHEIATNPSHVLDTAFGIPNEESSREVMRWWEKTSDWIQDASDNALKAVTQIKDTINDLQDLRNRMPAFVRDNIPKAIWDGIAWSDQMIDGKILPALTKINTTFDSVNAVLEGHRRRTATLVEQLTRPGDVLLAMDKLSEAGRIGQEAKIDDATSRKYERETDRYVVQDASIIAEFKRVATALAAPRPPPVFMTIEEMPPHLIPGIVLEDHETWFVGDY